MAEINLPDVSLIWGSSGDILKPSDTKIQQGWQPEIPARQWFNWLDNRQDQAIAHIAQHGISVWSSTIEYQAGKSYVQGSDGFIYKARTTHTNVNPVTDTTYINWTKYASGGLLNVQRFTSNTTYTPTPGTRSIIVEVQGAGGGGAGAGATGATQVSVGSGGGAGGYTKGLLTSGFSGAAIVVGVGGTGGGGVTNGGNGGSSSFGGVLTATGGGGGISLVPTVSVPVQNAGGNQGTSSGGSLLNSPGATGLPATVTTVGNSISGGGGASYLSQGAARAINTGPGVSGVLGAGGSGAISQAGGTAQLGGNGGNGLVIVWEYA